MAERMSLDWARIEVDDAPSAATGGADAPGPAERDFEGLNARLRDALSRLWASAMVRDDPECRAIFETLLVERGGEALDRAAIRLGQRVDALVAGRVPSVLHAPPPPPTPRSHSLLRSLFKL